MSKSPPTFSVAPALVLGVCLAVGLILSGYFQAAAVMEAHRGERWVTVTGVAEKEMRASQAVWLLSYEVTAADLPALGQSLQTTSALVREFLQQQGFPAESIQDVPPTVLPSSGTGWSGVGSVQVTTAETEKLAAALAATATLVGQGVVLQPSVREPAYSFQPDEETLAALWREAEQAAQRAAARLGDHTGQSIGAMRRVELAPLEILPASGVGADRATVRAVTTAEFYLR